MSLAERFIPVHNQAHLPAVGRHSFMWESLFRLDIDLEKNEGGDGNRYLETKRKVFSLKSVSYRIYLRKRRNYD